MSKLRNNALIFKRNDLNELRANNFTLQELRFFSIYLSKIDHRDINTKTVRFPLQDFKEIMEFEDLNIPRLRKSADSITEKKVSIPLESGGFSTINLFDEFTVDKDNNGDWFVQISASNAALPFMFDFKNRYFKYELWNALRLTAPSHVRMYELLKQYESIGKREIRVDELQDMLGTSYTRWERFKKNVLDSSQQSLKETTDISFTYERGKTGTGGKWLSIIFHISANEPTDRQMVLFEQDLECHIHLKALQKMVMAMDEQEPEPEPVLNDDIKIILDIYPQFTLADVKSMYNHLRILQPDTGSTGTARVDCFKRLYDDAIRENEKKIRNGEPPIKDYVAYIIGMIENRIKDGEAE